MTYDRSNSRRGDMESFANKNGSDAAPPFSGTDPIGWLVRANQQFEINGVSAEKKVSLAVVAIEEATLY